MNFLIIPTYKERDNILDLLERIVALKVVNRVVVVDDNSPDGTQEIVNDISRRHPEVQLLARHRRYGRGSAGLDGFRYALQHGAQFVAEMDADFSHDPAHLPALFDAARTADVVLGSRFVSGGRDLRGLSRRILTFLARTYVRVILKLSIRDVSSGYRVFSRKALEAIDLNNMVSTGPSIVLEILYKCLLKGMTIAEVPITFPERREGKSKLDYITLLESLVMVLRLRQMARAGRLF